MFKVYLDESGTHGPPATMIAGLIGRAEQWDAFERDWLGLLGNLNLTWFHARECEALENDFAHLNRGLVNDLSANLARKIIDHKLSGVTSYVWHAEWEQFKDSPGLVYYPTPYDLCFYDCIRKLARWTWNHAGAEPFALVLARQHEYNDRALLNYDVFKNTWGAKELFGPVALAEPREYPGLQAADLMGYEIYQFLIADPPRCMASPRGAARTLVDGKFQSIGNPQVQVRARVAELERRQYRIISSTDGLQALNSVAKTMERKERRKARRTKKP